MVFGTSFEMKYNLVFPFCTFAKEQMVSAVSINDHLLSCESKVKHVRNLWAKSINTELV